MPARPTTPKIVAYAYFLCCLLGLLSARTCLAQSPYELGLAQYDAGNYTASASSLEQAAKLKPDDPRVWWHLNFAYHKLNQDSKALDAVEKAAQLDPTHAFASSPAKFNEILAQRKEEAGSAARANQEQPGAQPGAPPPTAQEPVATGAEPGPAASAPPGAGGPPIGIIIVAIIAIVLIIVVIRSIGRGRGTSPTPTAPHRDSLDQQKSDVVAGVNFLQDNIHGLDPQRESLVRDLRSSAGKKLEEAIRLLNHGASNADLNRAQHLLDEAQADVARGRSVIAGTGAAEALPPMPQAPPVQHQAPPPQQARPSMPGFSTAGGSAGPSRVTVQGASNHSGFGGQKPPVATGPTTDWKQLPQGQKGVCFFCSRPMLLSELTPVPLNLDGKQQRVLACPDDLATIRTGQSPQIRAFNVNGRYVPWYAYDAYDPYMDYYARGYYPGAGSFLADMVAFTVIDDMFWAWDQPVGWGWGGGWGMGNPYTFYPDQDAYRDYYAGMAAG
ncbi:MAG TPA: tetratricopeptide repeat protein, partial [Chloroflexota bacterium]|nr:tetratricopeptide repeat protein [Chloroflexota bacterium]